MAKRKRYRYARPPHSTLDGNYVVYGQVYWKPVRSGRINGVAYEAFTCGKRPGLVLLWFWNGDWLVLDTERRCSARIP